MAQAHEPKVMEKSARTGAEALFTPLRIGAMTVPNRIVMAPMTRGFSPGGIPGPDVAAYYRRRAEGGVGLIITEGTWVPHPAACNDPQVPCFYGSEALAGWSEVARQVHAAGARIMPQLWHVGIVPKSDIPELYGDRKDEGPIPVGPSGPVRSETPAGRVMTQTDIDEVCEAYVSAAVNAFNLGFDGVELHAAHGYLIDQFFWEETNRRTDRYGGGIAARATFAADIVKGIHARTRSDFPVVLRFSQWKLMEYGARPWPTPQALEQFLAPLVDAGVDAFHCSQRRYWIPEFPGSALNLAGWTGKITGKPTITVGSVNMQTEVMDSLLKGIPSPVNGIDELFMRFGDGEFDLVAVGRALISNPDWAHKIRAGKISALRDFSSEMLTRLD